jgi:hypothetical protein
MTGFASDWVVFFESILVLRVVDWLSSTGLKLPCCCWANADPLQPWTTSFYHNPWFSIRFGFPGLSFMSSTWLFWNLCGSIYRLQAFSFWLLLYLFHAHTKSIFVQADGALVSFHVILLIKKYVPFFLHHCRFWSVLCLFLYKCWLLVSNAIRIIQKGN